MSLLLYITMIMSQVQHVGNTVQLFLFLDHNLFTHVHYHWLADKNKAKTSKGFTSCASFFSLEKKKKKKKTLQKLKTALWTEYELDSYRLLLINDKAQKGTPFM